MKKLIISILIITLLLSSMAFNINAAPELTQKQAEELLIAAYQRWYMFQWGGTTNPDIGVLKSDGGLLEEDYIKLEEDFSFRGFFDKRSDGTSFKYSSTPEKLDYVPITDPRFNTMDKCYAYLEEAFTDEWAYKILNLHWYRGQYGNGERYEIIRLSNGGKLYNRYGDDSSFEPLEDGLLMMLYDIAPGCTMMDIEDIGTLTVSGNTAKIEVTARIRESHRYDSVPPGSKDLYPPLTPEDIGKESSTFLVPYDMYINFEYTQSGWRVSGGTFFDTFMNRWAEPNKNPNTSDPTVPAVAILGTVAVISLALPVVVIYKRRRRAV